MKDPAGNLILGSSCEFFYNVFITVTTLAFRTNTVIGVVYCTPVCFHICQALSVKNVTVCSRLFFLSAPQIVRIGAHHTRFIDICLLA